MCFLKVSPFFSIYEYKEKYIGASHGTDIAHPFLILVPGRILVLELSKGVDHDTTHQILEQQLHEHNVDNIKREATGHESIHIVANCPTGVQFQHTVHNGLACLLRQILLIDHRGVGPKGKNIEH